MKQRKEKGKRIFKNMSWKSDSKEMNENNQQIKTNEHINMTNNIHINK